MPNIPSNIPGIPGGSRAQRAAQLKAEMEAKAAQQKAQAQFHHVQEGESLESIAGRYGQSADAVWRHPLNSQLRSRLGTPDKLGPGDGVYIPGGEQQQERAPGPVGQGDYVVQGGDCISSIAKNTGHFWERIWNDGANSELKSVRKDPNVLLPRDRVTIPEIRPKQEPGETEMRHRFVRRGEPAILRMRILIEDEPVANAPYKLTIDGQDQEGTTDGDGGVQIPIPGNARSGTLTVDAPDQTLVFPLSLGRIDPVTEPSGVQGRLNNLGYACGRLDGIIGPKSKAAIRQFQLANGHPNPSGEVDEQTRALLVEKHGS
ncbi:MAG: peptidoglycan-binding protein [Phycisphaerae bacterium]|nr:peptidoglycan-binding protein [Phycisphaerae bacterium]